ncbi:hypothetical protein Droror1_Dr00010719 [Drosera rotundifolia]
MDEKPHVVCVPYAAQGHINPMMRLAKLLYIKGFHVTLVLTEYNRNRLLRSCGKNSLDGLPSFRFEAIPDGLPPVDDDVTQDTWILMESMDRTCAGPLKELLARLNDTATSGVPPVTCIIGDGALKFTLAVAEELGIPNAILWTASAWGFLGYSHFQSLAEKGLIPLKDESYLTNGYLDKVIDIIPGMEGIPLKYLPSFLRTTDPNDFMFQAAIVWIQIIRQKASAIIFNTFTELERDVISSLAPNFPPLYPIGPLHLFVNQIEEEHTETKSLSSNLWKQDDKCLQWLDARPSSSVVYVNFGSITVMTPAQLVEFAWGLANSKHYFLWIIRPDLVSGDTAVLPTEFVEETKERGLLASWCDQESVLSHQAVCAFLTHNGWNSTIESISSGVPMICWPFFADQQPNGWFTCQKWHIGMEIDSEVRQKQVEKQVREIMEGEKGKEMRTKAMEWKSLAKDAATWESGSSYLNLERLIQDVLLVPKIKAQEGST